jgi:hypothetical protein
MRVVAQDVAVLRAQAQNLAEHGGERFMSTEIDVRSPSIRRLLKESSDSAEQQRGHSGLVALRPQVRASRDEEAREVTTLQILA